MLFLYFCISPSNAEALVSSHLFSRYHLCQKLSNWFVHVRDIARQSSDIFETQYRINENSLLAKKQYMIADNS